jgi:hypothetical protein
MFCRPIKDLECKCVSGNGIAFYAFSLSSDADMVPFYRCWVTGTWDHFLTTDSGCGGYQLDGQVGYISSTQRAGTVPLYEMYHYGIGSRLATVDYYEGANNGYSYIGVLGYVQTSP